MSQSWTTFRAAVASVFPSGLKFTAITVPVSIIGACIFAHLSGFSINILTLMACVLGIGLVVVVRPFFADSIQQQLADAGLASWPIGRIASGPTGVVWE